MATGHIAHLVADAGANAIARLLQFGAVPSLVHLGEQRLFGCCFKISKPLPGRSPVKSSFLSVKRSIHEHLHRFRPCRLACPHLRRGLPPQKLSGPAKEPKPATLPSSPLSPGNFNPLNTPKKPRRIPPFAPSTSSPFLYPFVCFLSSLPWTLSPLAGRPSLLPPSSHLRSPP